MPYLESGDITVDELVALLRSVEEYGRQHVFLYSCKKLKANELISKNRIEEILAKHGIEDLLKSPKIIDQPTIPTITDIRWESAGNNVAFVIKIVEQRIYDKLVEETILADDIYIKKYPGRIEIKLDKDENSYEAYHRIKSMCEGMKKVLTK